MILKEEYSPGARRPPIVRSRTDCHHDGGTLRLRRDSVRQRLAGDPGLGINEPIALLIAPELDVAMIYVFALSSIAVYGVILGGWASNNKYSFLGGLRSSAQMIAYELPLGLGILGVVLASSSLRLDDIIQTQAGQSSGLPRSAARIRRVCRRGLCRSGSPAV